nr:hypothetical protein [Tanacetum cinerariifolium]
VIEKSDVIVVPDSEDTLMHAEESRSKMIEKQNDPQMIEKKELFTSFDQCLIDEVTEVQNIFKQMELAVEQHCAKKTKFQTKMKNVLKENDRLLTQALSVEIVNIVVYDYVNFDGLNVDACVHCVTTESELKTNFIKKECYETLLQQYHSLETHCISLEVNNQLNTEIFQRDNVSSLESAPTFAELFEINEFKAQVQEKDTVILKLKEKLKSFSGYVKERKVERDVEEIETLNLELDHKADSRVAGKSDVIVVPDSENTLMHADESRSKMIAKQHDPQLIEKKTESYAEQAFWSQYSVQTDEPTHSGTTIVEVLKELPKVSM